MKPAQVGSAATNDASGRPLRDLRISLTDRCNFRCPYCMPADVFGRDHAFLPRREQLSNEELVRVVRVFVGLGVRKVRITGGEPLLRRDLEEVIAEIASVGLIDDLALTTNGWSLAGRAETLRRAGLQRVTVSLDSLQADVFAAMSGGNSGIERVLAGIEAAAAAGLEPVKVNAVIRRGVNDGEVVALAEHFRGTGRTIRFIEYMDVGESNHWDVGEVVPSAEIVAAISAAAPLEPVPATDAGDVARLYRYRDGSGEIGVVSSVTEPFCGDCTRARLSSNGLLYTCLFTSTGHDLRALLRAGASDAELTEQVALIWSQRDDRYSEIRFGPPGPRRKVEMSVIGG